MPRGRWLNRSVKTLRVQGTRAFAIGCTGTALIVGVVSASGQHVSLPLSILSGFAIGVAYLALASNGSRVSLAALLAQERRVALEIASDQPPRAASIRMQRALSLLQCDDDAYHAGNMSILRDFEGPWIAVTPTAAHEVGQIDSYPAGMFAVGVGSGLMTQYSLKGKFGLDVPDIDFRRMLPGGRSEEDHGVRTRDYAFLADLAGAVAKRGGNVERPFIWPEHTVDPFMLADHNVVVVGGPDTNFWHAALLELSHQAFTLPPSPIRLGVSTRSDQSGGVPTYGMEQVWVDVPGLDRVIPEVPPGRPAVMHANRYPSYAFILAMDNRLAMAKGKRRAVVLVFGMRSLATTAAVSALATVFGSELSGLPCNTTLSARVVAPSSVWIVRVTEAECMARSSGEPREVLSVPSSGAMSTYHDSLMPRALEILTGTAGAIGWVPISCRKEDAAAIVEE